MPDVTDMLIVLGAGQSPPPLRVTQRVSDRVFLVAPGGVLEKAAAQAHPAVAAVLLPGDPMQDAVRQTLNANEALFVDAFIRRARPKTRPGDGLNWDAPGFQPPDPPKR